MKNIITLILLLATSSGFAQFLIGQPDNIVIVENPFDGTAVFDLTINENQTLNGENPADYTLTYYISLADANAQTNPFASPQAYTNISNPETVYVRMEVNTDPNIFQVASFDIIVDANINLGFPNNLIIYEFPFDGIAAFDLTENESQILNGIDPSTISVTYHETQLDADTDSFPISNPEVFSVFFTSSVTTILLT